MYLTPLMQCIQYVLPSQKTLMFWYGTNPSTNNAHILCDYAYTESGHRVFQDMDVDIGVRFSWNPSLGVIWYKRLFIFKSKVYKQKCSNSYDISVFWWERWTSINLFLHLFCLNALLIPCVAILACMSVSTATSSRGHLVVNGCTVAIWCRERQEDPARYKLITMLVGSRPYLDIIIVP